MVRGEVEKQVKQLGPERKNCLCVRSSCTADRTWLPSSSHWVALFSLVEVGGESINLMEEKGQCRADFRRVVKGGQMIERWHKSHGGCRSQVGIGSSSYSAMIFSGKAQTFSMGRGKALCRREWGSLRQTPCVGMHERVHGTGGGSWMVKTLAWVVKGSISLHISSFKIDVYIPRCFPFLLQSLSVLGLLCFADFQFSCLVVSDSSMPGLPVHHQLPEFTQTHVHWVGDAIQPSHTLSSPSPPALNLS